MTAFVTIAIALVAVALLWLLPVLLRRGATGTPVNSGASNLEILRDQLAELERDLAAGTLKAEQYESARDELQRRVLDETAAPVPQGDGGEPVRSPRTALLLALAIPLCAALLYLRLGSPDAVLWQAAGDGGHQISPQQVELMVRQLAQRLEKNPHDGDGWVLLARSNFVLQRYPEAAAAYARATALIQDDAGLFADYADALAMSRGRSIDDEVMKVLEQALRLDPDQWKALAMAGTAAFDRKDYRKAVEYWEKLRARVDADSDIARGMAASIAEARQLGKLKPEPAQKLAEKPSEKPAAAGVQGSVSLSPMLAGKADPADTVFIFARAAQGSRMPLAIVRRQVKDLPFEFRLDDSHAMTPEAKLSGHTEVVIGARVSKSSNATPSSGDLQGSSGVVKVGSRGVAVVIDRLVP